MGLCICISSLCLFSDSLPSVLSYTLCLVSVLSYFIITPWKPICFPMRDKKGLHRDMRGGGKELREAERQETFIRIYYVRKKSTVSKRRKESICNV